MKTLGILLNIIILLNVHAQIIRHFCFTVNCSSKNFRVFSTPVYEYEFYLGTLNEDSILKTCHVGCNIYWPEKIEVESKLSCKDKFGDVVIIPFDVTIYVMNDYVGIGEIRFRKTTGWEIFHQCIKDTSLELENLVRENVFFKCICDHKDTKWEGSKCKMLIGGAILIKFVFLEK